MEQNNQNTNRIFQFAFTGSMLFILSIVFVLSNLAHITNAELPYTIIASILGASSFSLLYKAIKEDGVRLRSN
jgi:Kef-type K+ transport system membrane component KefB